MFHTKHVQIDNKIVLHKDYETERLNRITL